MSVLFCSHCDKYCHFESEKCEYQKVSNFRKWPIDRADEEFLCNQFRRIYYVDQNKYLNNLKTINNYENLHFVNRRDRERIDVTTTTHPENHLCLLRKSDYDPEYINFMQFGLVLDFIAKSDNELITCPNKLSKIVLKKSEWAPYRRGVFFYSRRPITHWNYDLNVEIVPFKLSAIAILNQLKRINEMKPSEMANLYFWAAKENLFIRSGEAEMRMAFEVVSVIKNFIYLYCFEPLVKAAYYETILSDIQLYCPYCPKPVSLKCECVICVYYRQTTTIFTKDFERSGHRIDCPTLLKD